MALSSEGVNNQLLHQAEIEAETVKRSTMDPIFEAFTISITLLKCYEFILSLMKANGKRLETSVAVFDLAHSNLLYEDLLFVDGHSDLYFKD